MGEKYPDDAVVRAEGAAAVVGKSVATFRRRVRAHGGPPSYRQGGHLVYRVGEVRRWWEAVESALVPIETGTGASR
ncbi:hypothetical protein [Kineococcus rhizosphaerae]|uniref:Helix-turn-helix protein n=1 Tax=Kineococcus rhizosphaerae TaxID=559628 RepID=A0A2T0QLU7_9ACTN|nr:hypothetical protein [Kineococcus rhizosphaerae]PRY05401.1 hypothetical protein CLV37_13913 [Kineococcus rhizosphaerae]